MSVTICCNSFFISCTKWPRDYLKIACRKMNWSLQAQNSVKCMSADSSSSRNGAWWIFSQPLLIPLCIIPGLTWCWWRDTAGTGDDNCNAISLVEARQQCWVLWSRAPDIVMSFPPNISSAQLSQSRVRNTDINISSRHVNSSLNITVNCVQHNCEFCGTFAKMTDIYKHCHGEEQWGSYFVDGNRDFSIELMMIQCGSLEIGNQS